MENILNNIYVFLIDLINSSSIYGPLLACLLIFLESIIPVLPLFVFITIIFISYGSLLGFIISYILTVLGCFFSYYLWQKFIKNIFKRTIRKNHKYDNIVKKIDKMKLSSLVLLISIPFTPAFLVNIGASLSDMPFKRFATAIIIGKVSLIIFWGFIGTSLVESFRNPRIMIIIIIMLLISYIVSKIVTKKLNIE